MDGLEDMVRIAESRDGRMLEFLEFLRKQSRRAARGVATQVTIVLAQKMIRRGWKKVDIARELGISERRVYQIQKNMK